MTISYEKLWELLKANKMRKQDLISAAQITPYALRMLGGNQAVSMNVLMNICKVFHCNIGDIMDFIEDEEN